jgi:hypothetical protein
MPKGFLGPIPTLYAALALSIWYSRNRSGTAEIDLVQQKSIWYSRNQSGTAEINLVQQKSIWHTTTALGLPSFVSG